MAGPEQNEQENSKDMPRWADCDCFCIHDYAGTGTAPCGWRGHLHDARHDANGEKLLCPHCGCATLFRIPLHRADEGNA